MKIIKRVALLLVLLMPSVALAASGSLSVSSASTGVVGNNLNVSVTLSSSTGIGSWEFDISYDRSFLQLTSSTTESGGTHAANYSGSGGIKSKTYNYTFKVLKSGSTTIRVSSSDVYAYSDESRMSITNGSKTVSLKTQAEIEASYSSDAYLKALSVGDYTLTPEFNKETKEYEVEVPNDVEKVTINATKNDANATVSGAGEKELQEGINKFEVVVTAQKGNSLTYTVNINRKELNPIRVNVDNKELSFVRKKDLLPELVGFVEDTVVYEGTEIPALYNAALGLKIVGLKDDNNTYLYTFKDGKVDQRYIYLSNGDITIWVLDINEDWIGFVNKEVEINGYKVKVVALTSDSKQVIIAGRNIFNDDISYYIYDSKTNTFAPYNLDDLYKLNKNNKIYKLIIIILSVVVVLLIALNLFKKGNKEPKEKKKNNKPIIDEFEDLKVEEVKDKEEIKEEKKKEKEEVEEVKQEIEEEKDEVKEEKKLSRRAMKKIREQEKLKELAEEKARLEEEEKRLKEEEQKEIESIKEDKISDYKEEDPIDEDDDFMDFWETREFKLKKKKNKGE